MAGLIDLTGQVFGKLTVLSHAGKGANGRPYWLCQCECGKQSAICGKYLRNGDTKSCGCDSGRSAAKRRQIDLTGKRFGRLVVLEKSDRNNLQEVQWLCQCDCGVVKAIVGARLRQGRTTSCGCLHRESVQALRASHRKSHTRTFRIWSQMKTRCSNPKNIRWHCYGGRGIKVCDRWMNSFESFLEDMGECPDGYSIERIDVNGNYEPSNCKWIPLSRQAANTRQNVFLTYEGKTQTIADWAREKGFPYGVLRHRIAKGWSVEEALTKPFERQNR